MVNKYEITKDGLEQLQNELTQLIEVERPTIIERIKEARSYGDLSENSEYDAAKTEQGMIESRIAEIEEKIRNAVVVKATKKATTKSKVGTFVTFENIEPKKVNGEKIQKYKLVGADEADPLKGLISVSSPLGDVLYGIEVGEIQEIILPNGNIRKIKVLKLEN